jgi:hypothetical protein
MAQATRTNKNQQNYAEKYVKHPQEEQHGDKYVESTVMTL